MKLRETQAPQEEEELIQNQDLRIMRSIHPAVLCIQTFTVSSRLDTQIYSNAATFAYRGQRVHKLTHPVHSSLYIHVNCPNFSRHHDNMVQFRMQEPIEGQELPADC